MKVSGIPASYYEKNILLLLRYNSSISQTRMCNYLQVWKAYAFTSNVRFQVLPSLAPVHPFTSSSSSSFSGHHSHLCLNARGRNGRHARLQVIKPIIATNNLHVRYIRVRAAFVVSLWRRSGAMMKTGATPHLCKAKE